jgi:flagellar hook-basal body complex protein FliE
MNVNLERPFIDGQLPIGRQAATPAPANGRSLGDTFAEALNEVGRVTKQADQAADGLVAGSVDIHEAMVSMEKADLMLKLGTTVRNKLLDAYQQLMNSGAG